MITSVIAGQKAPLHDRQDPWEDGPGRRNCRPGPFRVRAFCVRAVCVRAVCVRDGPYDRRAMREPELLRTERLQLVPVRRDVARAVVAGDLAALGREGLEPGSGWPHGDTLDGLRLALEHGGGLGWFAVLDGVVVGDCGTHGGPDADGAVEIGYGLAGPYRGRGLATELARALAGWLLADPDVRRVVATTHAAANPASRRVLEKVGFTFDRDDAEMAWYVLDP